MARQFYAWPDRSTRSDNPTVQSILDGTTMAYPESFERVCMGRNPSDNNRKARRLSAAASVLLAADRKARRQQQKGEHA